MEFKNLEIWNIAVDLTETIYILTKKFPKEEIYGLISQMRRCSLSIPSNIAEGKGRRTTKDFIQFLYIAKGSLNELQTQVIISKRLNFITEDEYNELEKTFTKLKNKLVNFISHLSKSN
jgi:four helix bundle protein